MDRLPLYLALNGLAVFTVSAVAGLMLWRVLSQEKDAADWHLLHASGSVRGVFLIALAPIIHLPVLPEWRAALATWLVILFTWTSVLAMIIRAFTGERGFGFTGTKANVLIHALYWIGGAALFPACGILLAGMLRAL